MDKRNCIHRQELLPKIKDRNKLRKFRKKTAKCTGLWKCICGKGPRRPSTIQTKENHHAHASTQWQKAFPVLRAKRIFVQSLHCLHMTGLCLLLQPGMSLIQNRSGAAAPLPPKPGSFFTGDPFNTVCTIGDGPPAGGDLCVTEKVKLQPGVEQAAEAVDRVVSFKCVFSAHQCVYERVKCRVF